MPPPAPATLSPFSMRRKPRRIVPSALTTSTGACGPPTPSSVLSPSRASPSQPRYPPTMSSMPGSLIDSAWFISGGSRRMRISSASGLAPAASIAACRSVYAQPGPTYAVAASAAGNRRIAANRVANVHRRLAAPIAKRNRFMAWSRWSRRCVERTGRRHNDMRVIAVTSRDRFEAVGEDKVVEGCLLPLVGAQVLRAEHVFDVDKVDDARLVVRLRQVRAGCVVDGRGRHVQMQVAALGVDEARVGDEVRGVGRDVRQVAGQQVAHIAFIDAVAVQHELAGLPDDAAVQARS